MHINKEVMMLVTVLILTFFLGHKAYAQNTGNDLTVVIENASKTVPPPLITKFIINGTNWLDLCNSGKCTIETRTNPYISLPVPASQSLSYTIDFKINDSMPQKNIGEKKREFLSQFSASMLVCKIDNIVEDNNQEKYYCHDSSNSITRNFDTMRWLYDTVGEYDAKTDTLTILGNYTHTG